MNEEAGYISIFTNSKDGLFRKLSYLRLLPSVFISSQDNEQEIRRMQKNIIVIYVK